MNNVFKYTFDIDEQKQFVSGKGTIEKKYIEKEKDVVLKELAKSKTFDGYRKGNAPLDVVERNVDGMEVWKECANQVFMKNFPQVLADEKHTPIDMPNLTFTSIAIEGDVDFSITYTLMPEIKVNDVESIIKDVKPPQAKVDVIITDAEVDSVLLDLKKASFKKKNKDKELPTEFPDLTLEDIKKFSPQVESIDGFTHELKENLKKEKKAQIKLKFRDILVSKILENTEVKIPESLITEETARAFENMKQQAESLKTTIDEYIKHRGITQEDFSKELKLESEKRIKLQFALNKLAIMLKIAVDAEELEKEVKRMAPNIPDLAPDELRGYVNAMLMNEKIFLKLEEGVFKNK